MFVNAVMIAKNRERLTWQSISSLYRNTDRKAFSLTVVDDCSDSSTKQKLEELSAYLGFHLVRNEETLGVGGSKNRGVEESQKRFDKGEYLYLSDNDVYFTPRWLDVLVAAEVQCGDRAKLIGGYCHPYNHPNDLLGELVLEEKKYSVYTHYALGGLSWFMRWETWEKYGKLDDTARGTCMSEDTEYCQRIRKDGYEVAATHPFVVHNTGRNNTDGVPSPGARDASPDVEGVIVE